MHFPNNKKLILVLFIFCIPLAFLVSSVSAESDVLPAKTQEEIEAYKEKLREEKKKMLEERNAQMEQKRQELQVKKEEMLQNRCENVNDRIQMKISRYQANREMYVDKYENIRERISTWIDRLETEGYDVASIRSKLAVLQTKIDNLANLHETLISELEDLKDLECGSADGQYKNQLQVSQQQLNLIREAVMDIRKYYLEEVKPEIIALRQLVVQDKASEAETE